MRIIGYIDHPRLKITIFKMDNKFSVKFESGLYEQTYKFRDGEGIEGANDIRDLVDEAFLEKVETELQRMHRIRLQALSRREEPNGEDEFDEII